MKVAVLQSNYIPWRGYFDLIHDVDFFLFYDDVQFTKNDWRNRNYIQTPSGPRWLTIPTGRNIKQLICDVRVDEDPKWRSAHWQTLRQNYRSAPYFGEFTDFFSEIYARPWKTLSELNQHLIQQIASRFLGVKTRFGNSRDFELVGRGQDRLLDLLEKVGAKSYLSGPAAKAYIDASEFSRRGIELSYKNYPEYRPYPQFYTPYAPRVSIVDLLFNVGPAASAYIWGTP